jgi:cell wall-associated NlpC family hydrolase
VVPPRTQGGALPHARPTRVAAGLARLAGIATACVALVALTPPSQAHADPAAVEREIDRVWAESEPLIEQYNAVHAEYEQNLAKQAELQAAIAPLEAQLSDAQDRVGAIAASVYKGSSATGTFGMLLESGTPGDLADRLTYLDVLSLAHQRELRDAVNLKIQYDAEKRPIDEVVARLAVQDTELAGRKAQIEARLDELQALRRQTYSQTGGTGSLRPWPCPAEYAPTDGYKAAAWACAQAGVPYVWAGASSRGYDCSGLTLSAWRQVGVHLPHNAAAQRRSMPYVNRADLQLGDLVFYYSDLHHVSIYVGDGKVMTAPRSGDVVRMRVLGNNIHSFGRPG